MLQYADNNVREKAPLSLTGDDRTTVLVRELIELTWVAKFISRFLLAVTRRGGGQGENIRESLLLPTTLLLGQERKGGGKRELERGNEIGSLHG